MNKQILKEINRRKFPNDCCALCRKFAAKQGNNYGLCFLDDQQIKTVYIRSICNHFTVQNEFWQSPD